MYKKLLLANQLWAKEKTKLNPDFFEALAGDQRPEILWVGCSDSRVPAEEITGVRPGELFVTRNVANQALPEDLSFQSVLHFSVEVLGISQIIVCGHRGCGGVKASINKVEHPVLSQWLQQLGTVVEESRKEWSALPEDQRVDRVVELNVIAQIKNLEKMPLIQKFWKQHKRPVLHGWVYDLQTGLLKEVIQRGP